MCEEGCGCGRGRRQDFLELFFRLVYGISVFEHTGILYHSPSRSGQGPTAVTCKQNNTRGVFAIVSHTAKSPHPSLARFDHVPIVSARVETEGSIEKPQWLCS